jgi:hypothetical protein
MKKSVKKTYKSIDEIPEDDFLLITDYFNENIPEYDLSNISDEEFLDAIQEYGGMNEDKTSDPWYWLYEYVIELSQDINLSVNGSRYLKDRTICDFELSKEFVITKNKSELEEN